MTATRAPDRWDVPDLIMNDLETAIRQHGAGSKIAAGYAMRWYEVQGQRPHATHTLLNAQMQQVIEPMWQRLIRATAQRLAS